MIEAITNTSDGKKLRVAKLLAASLALVLLCVFPANAFELFGRCFGSDCEKTIEVDEGIIDPRTYDVSVVLNNAVDPDLEDAIKSSSELWRGRQRAVGGSAGLLSRAKGDYRRIQGALYLDGYFAGSISIRVNGQEVSDLELGTELPDRSSLVVTVDPGSVYRFGRFEIRNRAPSPIDENDFVKLPKGFAIEPGDIARAGQVRAAGNLVVEEWRQQGYPKARIVNREVSAVHSNRELNVLLEADPGSRAVFGELAVSGAERVDEDFIAYMAAVERGKEYDPDEIAKAEKRLDRLDVFNLRKIEEAHAVSADGELPLELKVKEKKPRRIGAGATVSSTDGLGLQGYWIHRNLFGMAERIRLEAEVGGIGETFDADELDYRVAATFTKPGVFSPDIDWVTNVFAEREFNDTFEGETAGGSSVLTYLYSDTITLSGGGFVEYSRFEDAFGDRDFLTVGAVGTLVYDGRDNSLEPTKGFFADFKVQPFHEFEFANTGVRLDGEVRGYQALDADARTVLAARVRLGSLLGVPRNETPANFLYFAGGGGSVRGFGFNNIGVIEANGDVTGGRSLLEASVELRHRVTETFGVVGFVDAGTVATNSFIDFSQDLRVSAGGGIRYYTGLGPIRLDVAVPLNPESGDPDFGVFAGIGQAF